MKHNSKLTDAVVKNCRERRARGETAQALATEFGVPYFLMRNALRGRTYINAGGPIDNVCPDGRHSDNKLSAELATTIRHRAASGEKQVDLARDYGVSPGTVNYVVKRKTWRK